MLWQIVLRMMTKLRIDFEYEKFKKVFEEEMSKKRPIISLFRTQRIVMISLITTQLFED